MAKLQFMTPENLALYDELIRAYINTEDAKSIKAGTLAGNTLKLYRVENPTESTIPAYSIELPEADLSGVIAKMSGATADHVVTATADGSVKDSGTALADLATKSQITAVESTLNTVKSKADANADAITKINGTGEGSFAKAVADAKAELTAVDEGLDSRVSAVETAVTKLDGADTVEGSVKQQIKVAREAIEAQIEDSKYDDTALAGRVAANETAISTLNGTGAGSVKKQIDDAFNEFATNVTDDKVVNTYKELIDYCATHSSEAAEMAGDIAANAAAISTLETFVGTLPEGTSATTVIAYINEKVAAEQSRAQGIENGLDTRLSAVETKLGTGEGSVTEAIATAKSEAISTAAADATTKADKALADAKSYTDTKFEAVDALTTRVSTAESNITSHNTRIAALESAVGEGVEPIPEATIRALFA